MRVSREWAIASVALAAALATLPAQAASDKFALPALYNGGSGPIATTGNTSAPQNWRLMAGATFNGVAGAFDGTALLLFTSSSLSGTYACSGSLMQGGQYVLTAGHCADDLLSMSVQFGYTADVALQTRHMVSYVQNPGWNGTLDTGADLALIKLDAPVTNLPTYKLSTTNDVGKQILITGYGTSGNGSSTTAGPNWNDGDYGHYGYNTIDTTSDVFEAAWDAQTHEGVYTAPTFGHTYVSDFDAPNSTDYNTLQKIADFTGGTWGNTTGEGANEALIAGGDSGGGDFIWNGTEWVLTAVHSWGWQFCEGRLTPSCDLSSDNSSSYGDLSGSTAIYEHTAWINSVIGVVPEPGTYALMGLGLAIVGASARRRRAA